MEEILLHTCCACCSSYVIPHLQNRYRVTGYFFNPNIHPAGEYRLRLKEMKMVSEQFGSGLETAEYQPERWEEAIDRFRHLPERSERCWACYYLRLEETARRAAELDIGRFTTTLPVSPHKVYSRVVEAGQRAAGIHGVEFHAEDFKKKNGFKISVERSRELGITRQNYCGCYLSRREADERRKKI
ncbi:MAG: hypothetical protein GF417_14215 [Candidatus Latescibacteria bacterium]|nr:hypothetical protein [bacterium]MBD3425586.1 hypothetical protein [Candidatus Latescibacterota bacterium]